MLRGQPKKDLQLISHTKLIATTCITGSALALHCCKAHSKIIRKMENSTPCRIVTHENFILKLGTRDYVEAVTYYTFFLFRLLQWGLLPKQVKYNPFVTFPCPVLYSYFSRSNAQLEPRGRYSCFMAQMTCFSPCKDSPFHRKSEIWGFDHE